MSDFDPITAALDDVADRIREWFPPSVLGRTPDESARRVIEGRELCRIQASLTEDEWLLVLWAIQRAKGESR